MSLAVAPESPECLIAGAVQEISRQTRFPVAFGGLVEDGIVTISSIVGNRTQRLQGLRVKPERGLGGRAMTERRPRMTGDYGKSQHITHDYDAFVLGEGLRTLLAVPIVVDGHTRGVLYGGSWSDATVGGVTTAPAVGIADAVATELRIQDEVQRRLSALVAPASAVNVGDREDLRESYAELRSISAAITDAALRDRLAQVESRLLTLAGGPAVTPTEPVVTVHLSRRELDVLACVALGDTNATIAAQLGLREGTVKAYLGTAMTKLDAPTRHAAVLRARRMGLLP